MGLGSERESLVSLNPGPGYDVVVIDQERLVPLRGQSIVIRLESWQYPTDYRLGVVYTRGEPEVETPEEPPEEAPPCKATHTSFPLPCNSSPLALGEVVGLVD